MTLEDQLRDALDDIVARVPSRAGLADEVLRQARRRRKLTVVATAGGTAVAVAAGTLFVVADPLATDRPRQSASDGAASGGTAPDDVPDQGAGGAVRLDLDALSAGAAPGVPYYADGVIHVGDWEISFEGDFPAFRVLEEVAGGLVALVEPAPDDSGEGNLEVWLFTRDGGRTQLGAGQVYNVTVSPDGTQVAWSVHDWSTETEDSGPGDTVVYVADARTGEVLHTRESTGDDGPIGVAMGFLPDGRVVLDSATNNPSGIYLWDVDADTLIPWTDYGFVRAFSPRADLAVLGPRNDSDGRAFGVVDTATGNVAWTFEPGDAGRDAFSPDGRLLAVNLPSPDAPTVADEVRGEGAEVGPPGSVAVVDARTGEPVLRIEGGYPGYVSWESDGTLLVDVWSDDRTAGGVVRCTLDGECELAVPVTEGPDSGWPLLYTNR
ncbi:WD40 repeat domain-containing protein [Jiangella asiatica]|uniref:WD40 repeat domain-containing protein n=1 Tax=Jiangella asiatica TaxID=2530372 RepID=A0A4R5CJZ7_9ACTN|nr:hypothetical protein [Jiangella asiatica]TDE00582.1 hypothetical protein E1269_25040 [Jiangella asiatica]